MASRTRSGKVYSRANNQCLIQKQVDISHYQHFDPRHVMQFAFEDNCSTYSALVRLVSNPNMTNLPGSHWCHQMGDLWTAIITKPDYPRLVECQEVVDVEELKRQ